MTNGIESALAQAKAAAGSGFVSIAGGASTVNQYLVPAWWTSCGRPSRRSRSGAGARLFEDVGGLALEPISARRTDFATHVKYRVRK